MALVKDGSIGRPWTHLLPAIHWIHTYRQHFLLRKNSGLTERNHRETGLSAVCSSPSFQQFNLPQGFPSVLPSTFPSTCRASGMATAQLWLVPRTSCRLHPLQLQPQWLTSGNPYSSHQLQLQLYVPVCPVPTQLQVQACPSPLPVAQACSSFSWPTKDTQDTQSTKERLLHKGTPFKTRRGCYFI